MDSWRSFWTRAELKLSFCENWLFCTRSHWRLPCRTYTKIIPNGIFQNDVFLFILLIPTISFTISVTESIWSKITLKIQSDTYGPVATVARTTSITSQGEGFSRILDYTLCLFDPDHILCYERNRQYIRKSLLKYGRTAIAQWLSTAKCSPGFDTQLRSRAQPNLRLYVFVFKYTFLISTIYFAISVIDSILVKWLSKARGTAMV